MRTTDGVNTAAERPLDTLASAGPDPAFREELMLYGQFVGSWDFDWRGKSKNGEWRKTVGEWHYFWGLNGRAVIDTWICPSRSERLKREHPKDGEYGVTVRFYDPKVGAWHVTWNGAAHGNVLRFLANRVGDEIVQENVDDKNSRWIFSEIGPDYYRWRSELSTDDRKTWEIVEEMHCRRRGGPPAEPR